MLFYPLDFYSDQLSHEPLKVSLFARIHEMDIIIKQLHQLLNLSVEEKQEWLDENEQMLRDLLDKFVQHLPLKMEDDRMDKETVQLMIEYTGLLQEMTPMIHNILETRKNLKG
jgi:hypothetical protein